MSNKPRLRPARHTGRAFSRLLSGATVGATAVAIAAAGGHHSPSTAIESASQPVLASATSAPIVSEAPLPAGGGYWVAYANGKVIPEGAAQSHGDVSSIALAAPVVSITSTPDGGGYWLLAADGGVFSFGDAHFYGSTGSMHLVKPVVAMAPTPTGRGYWLVAADGGVFSFGDARFYGSTGNVRLARPVVAMAPSASGAGYWLVAADGGVFSFGNARFYGSTGNIRLAAPVVAMAATTDHRGYWLAGADGGVFTFGDAAFHGSAFGTLGSAHAVGVMAAGSGYWLLSSAGKVYSYGAPAVPSANPPASVPVTAGSVPAPAPTAAPGGQPNASNTGPQGVALLQLNGRAAGALPAANTSPAGCASWNGSTVVTNSDGCTITGVSWKGDFQVEHNNTTLNRVQIIGPGTENSSNIIVSVNWAGGNHTGTVIENSDIHDGTAQGSMYCVAGFNFTLVSDNIADCTHLFNLYGQSDNVKILNSYLHNPIAVAGDHVELLYAAPGASNVTLTGNNWMIAPEGGTTASIFLDGTNQDSNWVVSGNWFDGTTAGASNWNTIQADTSGITFQDNRIGLRSNYGPYLFNSYPPSKSGGNVWMYSGTTPSSWSQHANTAVSAGTEVPGI